METKNIWKTLKENKEIIGIILCLGCWWGFKSETTGGAILIAVGMISIVAYLIISRKIGSYKTAMLFLSISTILIVLEIIYAELIFTKLSIELVKCSSVTPLIIMLVTLGMRIKDYNKEQEIKKN